MRKIYIFEVGCEKRGIDTIKLIRYFQKNNYTITKNPKIADVIIISTCAYAKAKEDKSIKVVDKLKKYSAVLIISGCLGAINKKRLNKHLSKCKQKIIIISPRNINDIDQFFPEHKYQFNNIPEYNQPFINDKKICENFLDYFKNLYIALKKQKGFFFIRISSGCLCNCSFCGIKKAIGNQKSKPIKQITTEFKKGLKEGYRTFKLLADDATSYGFDIGTTFPNLLRELTNFNGDYSIYIEGANPKYYLKYANDLSPILNSGKIRMIGIPIQSGCKRILKLMNRDYDPRNFIDILNNWREKNPKLKIDCHLIVGFPTETIEEFLESIELISKLNCSKLFLFPYQDKPGTKAEKIMPKVSEIEIENRIKITKKAFLNSKIKVIIDGPDI